MADPAPPAANPPLEPPPGTDAASYGSDMNWRRGIRFYKPSVHTAYPSSDSSSVNRRLNSASAASTGAGVDRSTPAFWRGFERVLAAARLQESEVRFARSAGPPWSTFCDSATAAEMPVAYL